MVYSKVWFGAISRYNQSWFLKIVLDTDGIPILYISESVGCNNLLKATFFVLYKSTKQRPSLDQAKNLIAVCIDFQRKQPTNPTNRKRSNPENNNTSQSKQANLDNNKPASGQTDSVITLSIESYSSPGWWHSDELSNFFMTWLCCPERTQFVGHGLAGDIRKVNIDGNLSVVLKLYDTFRNDDLEDWRTVDSRRHIDNEDLIYMHLNQSGVCWPSHVPHLHYAGSFLSFRGVILSFVEGRKIKFSRMIPSQKAACVAALEQLHQHEILHGDIHYGNFIIDWDNKAYIIDFGFSKVCTDADLLEKEMMLLKSKLSEGDNTVDQVVNRRACKSNDSNNNNDSDDFNDRNNNMICQ
jgi:tRNA A-37 threonylcarbamoyl transferase component Bud32